MVKKRITDPQFDNVQGLKESHALSNMPPGSLIDVLNMKYDERGGRKTRNGYVKKFTLPDAVNVNTVFDFTQQSGTQYVLVAGGTKIYKQNVATATAIKTGLGNNKLWRMQDYLDLCYGVAEGETYWKFDGTTFSNIGIHAPVNPPPVALQAGGALTAGSQYRYFVTFYDSATGTESSPYGLYGDAPAITPTPGNQTVRITFEAKAAGDQVDKYRVYRTSAGGTMLLRIQELDYATYEPVGGTGFWDDAGAADGTIEIEYDNDVPQAGGCDIIEYKDRLYILLNDSDYGTILLYSKNGGRAYAWPMANFKAVGAGDGSTGYKLDKYGDVLIIKKGGGVYMLTDDPASGGVIRQISDVGVASWECGASCDDFVGWLSSEGFYAGKPTENDRNDLRKENIGKDFKKHAAQINFGHAELIRVARYETAELKHLYWAVPYPATATEARYIAVFDYRIGEWTFFEVDHPITAFGHVKDSGRHRLYFGDDIGQVFMWDEGRAEGIDKAAAVLNGTATAGAATTLTDTTKTWTVNEFAGLYVYIRSGTGAGQRARIVSNTATELTVAAAWATNPDATSVYAIARSRKYNHEFWNHAKYPDVQKRIRWVRPNFDQDGADEVEVTVYKNQSTAALGTQTMQLRASEAMWGPTGSFRWGDRWGGSTTATKRLRFSGKCRYFSFMCENDKAGTYFGLDSYITSFQPLYDRVD